MTLAHLIACPSCARHVRLGEAACPFCRADLGDAARAFAPRQAPSQRLSRAALYAFGVGSLTVASACGGVVGEGAGDKDGGHTDADIVADSAHGGSPETSSVVDARTPGDVSNFTVPYGVPPFDAGAEMDAGDDVSDAGLRQDVAIGLPYGGPPK
jgi:hypothetical protein